MGSWLDVDTGLNSENDDSSDHFAARQRNEALGVRRGMD
jgi:hypothetical protein